ncbi:ATP-binding protein [Rhizobium sp. LjRoot98]
MLETNKIDDFAATLEEATRSTREGVKYFIEPAQGTLSRAKSKRHHLIFGRRGSGKSSLLNKLVSEFNLSRTPVAYIDLETFKGHSYPDVLVSILIKTLSSYEKWMETAAILPGSKQSFWEKLFGKKPTRKALDKGEVAKVSNSINKIKVELEHLLSEAETIDRTRTARQSLAKGGEGTASLDGPSSNLSAKATISKETEKEIVDTYENKKIEILHRRILEFKDLFEKISACADGSSYILLDDLYHIRKSDQAMVID